jgi:hypothetical protein
VDIDVDSATPGCPCETPAENCDSVQVHMDGSNHVVDVCCEEIIPEAPYPPVCCWCIYEVWYYGPDPCGLVPPPPPAEPRVTEATDHMYYLMHTDVEYADVHYEDVPGFGDYWIMEPSYEQHTQLKDLAGNPLTWALRCNAILGNVAVKDMAFWKAQSNLITWKQMYRLANIPEDTLIYAVNLGVNVTAGSNAGYPYAVGNQWETTTFALGSASLGRSTVIAEEDITRPNLGTVHCYKVLGESWSDDLGDWVPTGMTWYSNQHGCAIIEEVYPGALINGWEYRDIVWYCQDPPPDEPWSPEP